MPPPGWLAALVVVALAAVPVSGAAPLDLDAPPAPFPAIGQDALKVAPTFWGRSACADVRELPASASVLGASMASGGCTIFWDASVSPTSPLEWCTRVIHEYGHLLGLGHSDDPWSAMYGGGRVLLLTGPFKAQSSSQGFCYGHGFYRTWKPVGVLATS